MGTYRTTCQTLRNQRQRRNRREIYLGTASPSFGVVPATFPQPSGSALLFFCSYYSTHIRAVCVRGDFDGTSRGHFYPQVLDKNWVRGRGWKRLRVQRRRAPECSASPASLRLPG